MRRLGLVSVAMLGGNVSVVGGVARTQEFNLSTSTTRADFGLSFSF